MIDNEQKKEVNKIWVMPMVRWSIEEAELILLAVPSMGSDAKSRLNKKYCDATGWGDYGPAYFINGTFSILFEIAKATLK